jgi:hypothetical protein
MGRFLRAPFEGVATVLAGAALRVGKAGVVSVIRL